MAPVKRSTTTAQRETRATRAATVAKKKTTAADKRPDTEPVRKTLLTETRSTAPARRGRRTAPGEQADEPAERATQEESTQNNTISEPAKTRAVRATGPSTGLAAAPRRRVKITPLNAPTLEAATKVTDSATKSKTKAAAPNTKTSTRSKDVTAVAQDELMQDAPAREAKVKPTRKTTKTVKADNTAKVPSPKTRGRPKGIRSETKEPPSVDEPAATSTTRSTRSRRAESAVSSETPASSVNAVISKPATGVRKKVTFQELPHGDDKENQPLSQAKPNKGSVKDTDSSKGLRAKPIRKAATTAASTRGRKATKQIGTKSDAVKEDKKMPRALTPKKVTQVARSSPSEQEGHDNSDSEDELNGGKTPIRDLSVSPRRPNTTALARLLSPVKKLEFGQSLVPKSPERTAVFRDEGEQNGTLASPARRPAASPFKDSLKDSPKRGLNENAKLLFPSNSDASASISSNAANLNTSVQAMPTMLQSPKRVGTLEPNFFSQSAMKKSVSKSPFKTSLFGSPAKRLFSPAKKSPVRLMQRLPTPQNEQEQEQKQEQEQTEGELDHQSEMSASSHFRSSSSPLRVIRMTTESDDMDFDGSILEVARSPLKLQNSPPKSLLPSEVETTPGREETVQKDSTHACMHETRTSGLSDDDTANREQQENSTVIEEVEVETNLDKSKTPASSPMTEAGTDAVSASASAIRPRLSEILFRSTNNIAEDESSEDELAGDATPVRSLAQGRLSTAGTQSRSRLSTGVPQSNNGSGFGFTPLAAQMSGWLATSPETSPENDRAKVLREGSADFSPVARQHIDGEVVLSRDSTPVQKLSKHRIPQSASTTKPIISTRKSLNLRKSLAARQSLSLFSSTESPARNQQFDEYMEIRAMEEQANSEQIQMDLDHEADDRDFHEIMNMDENSSDANDEDDTILEHEDNDITNPTIDQASDLTTDLIKFTHTSDTAMVDFLDLAKEADDMADREIETESDETASIDDVDEPSAGEDSSKPVDTHNVEQVDSYPALQARSSITSSNIEAYRVPVEEIDFEISSPLLRPTESQLDSPSVLFIDQIDSHDAPTSPADNVQAVSPASEPIIRTPQQKLKLTEQRIINTVVSKVPLKPEGFVSPIKMPKKRSQSFGDSGASPTKRISLEDLRTLAANKASENFESPNRRLRTSVAPSPGGTSTPAVARSDALQSGRYSLGAMSTPGQVSFMIDDFGDSTLDGIELPDDFADDTELIGDEASPAQSVRSVNLASTATTPKTTVVRTPATSRRRTIGRTTTPAASSRKTPKAPVATSNSSKVERTPLGPVGKGLLHGAIVFVDVHTSEGADASGIFIELLTQMGARCVREWRWNSRASLASNAHNGIAEQNIGITHVVFKDGSKRTLEKVRDARGEVCCVGVAWVLDCERENKWLDESTYTIDTKIVPRGGSNRRKSMEPRALLVGNDGSVSTSRPRRSVSTEMSEVVKRELLKTPGRGQDPASSQSDDDDDDENDENLEHATPTGYVAYDPRVAMTPGTPYLVSQGKKLTQMSAPPKQQNKSIFDDEDEENEDSLLGCERGNAAGVKDAKKFRMKNLGEMAKRRRTLGWKPAVGSPLSRN